MRPQTVRGETGARRPRENEKDPAGSAASGGVVHWSAILPRRHFTGVGVHRQGSVRRVQVLQVSALVGFISSFPRTVPRAAAPASPVAKVLTWSASMRSWSFFIIHLA
jgi:hypothetical protein